MTTVRIQNANDPTVVTMIDVFQRVGNGLPDTLVETRALTSVASVADMGVSATQYLVVREPTDSDAKTIDNWSSTPPPTPEA